MPVRKQALIKQTYNFEAVKRSLVAGYPEWENVNTNLWFKTMLSMWQIPDHGLVNELGHGMPFPNKSGFDMLAYKVIPAFKQKFESLPKAIHFPGTNQPYQIFPLSPSGDGSRVATLFQFNHTPRDMLIFIAKKINGKWMITGMSWIVS